MEKAGVVVLLVGIAIGMLLCTGIGLAGYGFYSGREPVQYNILERQFVEPKI